MSLLLPHHRLLSFPRGGISLPQDSGLRPLLILQAVSPIMHACAAALCFLSFSLSSSPLNTHIYLSSRDFYNTASLNHGMALWPCLASQLGFLPGLLGSWQLSFCLAFQIHSGSIHSPHTVASATMEGDRDRTGICRQHCRPPLPVFACARTHFFPSLPKACKACLGRSSFSLGKEGRRGWQLLFAPHTHTCTPACHTLPYLHSTPPLFLCFFFFFFPSRRHPSHLIQALSDRVEKMCGTSHLIPSSNSEEAEGREAWRGQAERGWTQSLKARTAWDLYLLLLLSRSMEKGMVKAGRDCNRGLCPSPELPPLLPPYLPSFLPFPHTCL